MRIWPVTLSFVFLAFFTLPLFAQDNIFNSLQYRAEQGDANAQYELARSFATSTNGSEGTRNWYRAFDLYKKAAEQGHINAQYELGKCYLNGNGCVKNEEMAYKWFKVAKENGHLDAREYVDRKEGESNDMTKFFIISGVICIFLPFLFPFWVIALVIYLIV